jgi:hypothetical protein
MGGIRLLFSACDCWVPHSLLAPLTPRPRVTRRRRLAPRPVAVIAAISAALAAAAMAGCSSSGTAGNGASLPLATIDQRYTAAVDPANAALAAMLHRALAYSGGPTTDIDSAVPPTSTALSNAAHQVRAIAAPAPLRRDIVDVANALNVVVKDSATLGSARGNDVQPAIARLVADAGREAAADNLVRQTLIQLTTPTTAPPPTLEPATLPTTTIVATIPRHTTTTRARTTTTTRRLSTTTTAATGH